MPSSEILREMRSLEGRLQLRMRGTVCWGLEVSALSINAARVDGQRVAHGVALMELRFETR